MAFKGQHSIVPDHAAAIVGNSQEPSPAGFNVDNDAHRARINRILDQFLRDRSRALDNFAGGDLIGNVIGKNADYGH